MAATSPSVNGHTPSEVLWLTWKGIRSDDVFGRAAQLAYCFFLALFPFLICVVATLSLFGSADRGRALLFGFLSQLLPAPAVQLITTTFKSARFTWHLAEWPFAAALLLLDFAVTYYFAPDLKDRSWRWITPGSLLAVVLLLLVCVGLRIYLHFMES